MPFEGFDEALTDFGGNNMPPIIKEDAQSICGGRTTYLEAAVFFIASLGFRRG